jgi:hypothetical protein
MRATVFSVTMFAWLIVPLWLVGVVCGAVHPAGVLFAAIDVPLAVWLAVALGTWLGVRPGTSGAASSTAALGSFAIVGAHTVAILAALSSNRDLHAFAGMDVRLQILATVLALLIPAATALIAQRLGRITFLRFDEWVDRPRRAPDGATAQPSVPSPGESSKGSGPATVIGGPAFEV